MDCTNTYGTGTLTRHASIGGRISIVKNTWKMSRFPTRFALVPTTKSEPKLLYAKERFGAKGWTDRPLRLLPLLTVPVPNLAGFLVYTTPRHHTPSHDRSAKSIILASQFPFSPPIISSLHSSPQHALALWVRLALDVPNLAPDSQSRMAQHKSA